MSLRGTLDLMPGMMTPSLMPEPEAVNGLASETPVSMGELTGLPSMPQAQAPKGKSNELDFIKIKN